MKNVTMTRSGILLVDKAPGFTSHDVVSRTRKLAGTRKVGHAGTLDPMATGLLVLGLNSSTRLLTFLVGLGKEYYATIRLGQSTDTDDAEGDVTAVRSADHVDDAGIRSAIMKFVGEIDQVPSSVSAIKINGKRAYNLVREGKEVDLAARRVTISAVEVLDIRREAGLVDIDVRVECSSGTYIRAIARDLGAALEVGGHLTALRRTKVGPFSVADAIGVGDRETKPTEASPELVERMLEPAAVATTLFPALTLDGQQTIDLVHGKRIPAGEFAGHRGPIAALDPSGILVGLIEARGTTLRPIVNFPTDEVLS